MTEWAQGRCPCCRKKVSIQLGLTLNMTHAGWNNVLSRSTVEHLATEGTCPWCGRETTIVARVLMTRFEPTLRAYAREGLIL